MSRPNGPCSNAAKSKCTPVAAQQRSNEGTPVSDYYYWNTNQTQILTFYRQFCAIANFTNFHFRWFKAGRYIKVHLTAQQISNEGTPVRDEAVGKNANQNQTLTVYQLAAIANVKLSAVGSKRIVVKNVPLLQWQQRKSRCDFTDFDVFASIRRCSAQLPIFASSVPNGTLHGQNMNSCPNASTHSMTTAKM